MLGKDLVKELIKRKWVDIMKQGSNPTQKWHRIRSHADTALEHLILLANKMPDEKQKEIFDEKNKIVRLLESLLQPDFDLVATIERERDLETEIETQPHLNARRATLAKTLVKLGTDVCMNQYMLLMRDTPNLAEPIISHLKQSAAICEDIAYRSELTERDLEAEKQERVYLFEWNKIARTKYNRRFTEFIRKGVKFENIELGPIKLSKNGKIQGTFVEASLDFEPEYTWSFTLELDDVTAPNYAGLKVFDQNGNERASKKLMVKKDHSSISVYAKKKK